MKSRAIISTVIFLALLPLSGALAQNEKTSPCTGDDMACLFKQLESTTDTIEDQRWRDQTNREIAKLYASNKQEDRAIEVLHKIKNPDTIALTIRGIGMNAADAELMPAQYKELFTTLRAEAEKIEHPPSYSIALTYIAMAQAFAGDDDGAIKTAQDMDNSEMRNKSLKESSEVQAERKDLPAAFRSIEAIDDPAYRDRAFAEVSNILADQQEYDLAYQAIERVKNNYKKSQAILYLLARQITPEEARLR